MGLKTKQGKERGPKVSSQSGESCPFEQCWPQKGMWFSSLPRKVSKIQSNPNLFSASRHERNTQKQPQLFLVLHDMREIWVDNLSIKTFACDRIPSYAQNPCNNIIKGACTPPSSQKYNPRMYQGPIIPTSNEYQHSTQANSTLNYITLRNVEILPPKKFKKKFLLKQNKESDEIFKNISFLKLESS